MEEKKNVFEMQGVVEDALPNAMFKVRLEQGGNEVLATISGKIRTNHIRIIQGDDVIVEISTYDVTRGRIVRRLTGSDKR